MTQSNSQNQIMSTQQPIVFYDGGCSLCQREIHHYQKMKGAETINWINIDQQPELLTRFDITHRNAMQRLHVIDSNGVKKTGAYAFVVIWRNLTAMKWLSIMLEELHLIGLTDRGYSAFAKWRFKRRVHQTSCQINSHT